MLRNTGILLKSSALTASTAALWLGLVTSVQAGSAGAVNAYDKDVKTHPSQGDVRVVEGAAATLLTAESGAFARLETRELAPGNAYTLWWVVINAPEACETSPCKPPDMLKRTKLTKTDVHYGDGVIAAEDGTARFAGYLPAGPLSNGWFGNGFDNPLGAEIHLVINDHGPLRPELVATMLGSYRGGCTDESLPKAFPDTAKADGTPGPNTCRMVQDVIFSQQGGQ